MAIKPHRLKISARLASLLPALVLLSACGSDETVSSLPAEAPASPAMEGATTDADRDWAALGSSPEGLTWQPGSGTLTHFLRDVQQARLRLRTEGLRFWQTHTDDSRRHSWLIMTAVIPPAYALDTEEWAREEARLGPNRAAIDKSAQAAWENVYPAMRAEVWNAKTTTDEQRRLLWSGEIRQKLLRVRNARARGEALPAADELLEEILDYAEAYAQPMEGDYVENNAYWYLSSLTDLALGRRDVFALEDADKIAFGERLAAIGRGVAKSLGERIVEQGGYTQSWWGKAGESLDAHFAERGLANWDDWYALESRGEVLSALFYDTMHLPAFGQPRSPEGYALHGSDGEIAKRRFVEAGIGLWADMTRREKRFWLHWASREYPQYTRGYMTALTDMTRREWRSADIDRPLRNAIDARFAGLMSEYLDDAETTDEDRSFVRALQVRMDVMRIMGPADRGETNVDRVLEGIRDLHVNYRHPDAVQFATWIQKDPERVGASVQQLRSFFESMLEDEDETMRNLATVALDPTAFDREPFVFEAPTMDGEPFDIEDLRGKVVLVDHWDTDCASCIAAFPTLHDIYLEYKDQGFEVVSIAYDGGSEEKSVRRIKDSLGLSWITLNGEGKWNSVAARYLYTGYPQYMLLDREGRVVAGSEELRPIAGLGDYLDEMLRSPDE